MGEQGRARKRMQPAQCPLVINEVVTIGGTHQSRWQAVFRILDEALGIDKDNSRNETVCSVRQGLTRRAS